MMKQDFTDFEVSTSTYSGGSNEKFKQYEHWFHPFCAFASAQTVFIKDLSLLQGVKFKDPDSSHQICIICRVHD